MKQQLMMLLPVSYTHLFTTNLNIDVTPTTKVEIGAQGYLGEGNYPAISSADLYNAAMSLSLIHI